MDGRVSSLILLLNVVFQRKPKGAKNPELDQICRKLVHAIEWASFQKISCHSQFFALFKKWPLIFSSFSPAPYSCFSKIRKNTGTFVWNFGTFRNNRTLWVNTTVDTTILIKGLLDWLKGPLSSTKSARVKTILSRPRGPLSECV